MAAPTLIQQPNIINAFPVVNQPPCQTEDPNPFAIDTKRSSPVLQELESDQEGPNIWVIIGILAIMFPTGAAWLLSGGKANLRADAEKCALFREAYDESYRYIQKRGDDLKQIYPKTWEKELNTWALQEMPNDVRANSKQRQVYLEGFEAGYYDAANGNRYKTQNKYSP